MKAHTFRLLKKRPYRQAITLFIKDGEGKLDKRRVTFTTEHLVREIDRTKKAKTVYAELTLENEIEIEAAFRDTSYGITFVLKGDDEGKLKKEPYSITPMDSERVAIKNLFKNAGMDFDDSKPNAVLRQELTIYLNATSDNKVGQGQATSIKHEQIDVQASIGDQVQSAIKAYEETTGEEFPQFADKSDTLNFIDGIHNPKFDKAAFISERAVKAKEVEGDDEFDLPSGDAEALGVIYQEVFGTKVANIKKNDAAWIEGKIREKKAE